MIHVNRSGTTLGTFSEEDVRAGLKAGRFLPSDLGWREGMPQWQPLSQFTEFASDIPTAAAPGAPPGAAIPQAAPAIVPAPTLAARGGLPWDNRHSRGFIPAFFDTLVMVLTKPGEAFTAMRREGGFGDPLGYALIGGCFGYLVCLLFMFAMPSLITLGASRRDVLPQFIGMGFGMVFLVVLLPLFLVISIFIGAAIMHVCLMIVGGARQPFETTFRVLCFSVGSTQPLIIVPFCGSFIAGVWGLVCDCIGLARAHETDTGRAVLAVFLPLIVCCGFWFLALLMIPALVHHSN